MIHRKVDKTGKKTLYLPPYGMLKVLCEQEFLTEIIDQLYFSTSISHQTPGTKIFFDWNSFGEQVINDSYREKFFILSRSVLENLSIRLPSNNDELANILKLVLTQLSAITKNEHSEQQYKALKKELTKLKNKLKPLSEFKSETDIIRDLLSFAERSVSSNSFPLVKTGIKIDEKLKEEIAPQEYGDSLRSLLVKSFPKNIDVKIEKREKLKKFKDKTIHIVNSLISVISSKRSLDTRYGREIQILNLIAASINSMSTQSLLPDEKLEIIHEIILEIESLKPSNINLMHEILEYKEAYDLSMRYGLSTGITFYHSILEFVKKSSEEYHHLMNEMTEWGELVNDPDLHSDLT